MDRRVLLQGATAIPLLLAASRLRSEPSLSDEERMLLRMCARDFRDDELGEYPTFDYDGAVVALARRMEEQGLLVFHVDDDPCVLPNGERVSEYYTASEYGRALLRANQS